METGGQQSVVVASTSAINQRPLPVGLTPLMAACQQGKLVEVRTILQKKPHLLMSRDRSGKTALHYCAENASPSCADQLLNVYADLINIQDEEGYTALHLAVLSGNKVMTSFLIIRGADVNIVDNERHSCIHWATVCGEVECLDMLIDAGANPSTPDIHGAYPIHYAAQMCGPNSEMGNDVRLGLAILQTLISRKVDVNCQDQDGRQPLLWAASAGSSDAILSLVNAGADVSAQDKDGLTALHCAASRGHLDCLETLLTLCGASVDQVDSMGCSALFYAVTLGHADCTQLLLQHGADPDRQDKKGRTPAHCGAAKGQLETLKILANHGANLWMENIRGDLPLHEAIQSGRKDLVRWLLDQLPTAVNTANTDGRTSLHIAAINNNVEMCKVLMDAGANVNPVMKNKGQLMTPLDAALYRGNRGCAKYLLLHGALPAGRLNSRTSNPIGDKKDLLHVHPIARGVDSAIGASPLGLPLETPAALDASLDERMRCHSETSVQTDFIHKERRDADVQVHLSHQNMANKVLDRPMTSDKPQWGSSTDYNADYNHSGRKPPGRLDKMKNSGLKQAIITNVYVRMMGDKDRKMKGQKRRATRQRVPETNAQQRGVSSAETHVVEDDGLVDGSVSRTSFPGDEQRQNIQVEQNSEDSDKEEQYPRTLDSSSSHSQLESSMRSKGSRHSYSRGGRGEVVHRKRRLNNHGYDVNTHIFVNDPSEESSEERVTLHKISNKDKQNRKLSDQNKLGYSDGNEDAPNIDAMSDSNEDDEEVTIRDGKAWKKLQSSVVVSYVRQRPDEKTRDSYVVASQGSHDSIPENSDTEDRKKMHPRKRQGTGSESKARHRVHGSIVRKPKKNLRYIPAKSVARLNHIQEEDAVGDVVSNMLTESIQSSIPQPYDKEANIDFSDASNSFSSSEDNASLTDQDFPPQRGQHFNSDIEEQRDNNVSYPITERSSRSVAKVTNQIPKVSHKQGQITKKGSTKKSRAKNERSLRESASKVGEISEAKPAGHRAKKSMKQTRSGDESSRGTSSKSRKRSSSDSAFALSNKRKRSKRRIPKGHKQRQDSMRTDPHHYRDEADSQKSPPNAKKAFSSGSEEEEQNVQEEVDKTTMDQSSLDTFTDEMSNESMSTEVKKHNKRKKLEKKKEANLKVTNKAQSKKKKNEEDYEEKLVEDDTSDDNDMTIGESGQSVVMAEEKQEKYVTKRKMGHKKESLSVINKSEKRGRGAPSDLVSNSDEVASRIPHSRRSKKDRIHKRKSSRTIHEPIAAKEPLEDTTDEELETQDVIPVKSKQPKKKREQHKLNPVTPMVSDETSDEDNSKLLIQSNKSGLYEEKGNLHRHDSSSKRKKKLSQKTKQADAIERAATKESTSKAKKEKARSKPSKKMETPQTDDVMVQESESKNTSSRKKAPRKTVLSNEGKHISSIPQKYSDQEYSDDSSETEATEGTDDEVESKETVYANTRSKVELKTKKDDSKATHKVGASDDIGSDDESTLQPTESLSADVSEDRSGRESVKKTKVIETKQSSDVMDKKNGKKHRSKSRSKTKKLNQQMDEADTCNSEKQRTTGKKKADKEHGNIVNRKLSEQKNENVDDSKEAKQSEHASDDVRRRKTDKVHEESRESNATDDKTMGSSTEIKQDNLKPSKANVELKVSNVKEVSCKKVSAKFKEHEKSVTSDDDAKPSAAIIAEKQSEEFYKNMDGPKGEGKQNSDDSISETSGKLDDEEKQNGGTDIKDSTAESAKANMSDTDEKSNTVAEISDNESKKSKGIGHEKIEGSTEVKQDADDFASLKDDAKPKATSNVKQEVSDESPSMAMECKKHDTTVTTEEQNKKENEAVEVSKQSLENSVSETPKADVKSKSKKDSGRIRDAKKGVTIDAAKENGSKDEEYLTNASNEAQVMESDESDSASNAQQRNRSVESMAFKEQKDTTNSDQNKALESEKEGSEDAKDVTSDTSESIVQQSANDALIKDAANTPVQADQEEPSTLGHNTTDKISVDPTSKSSFAPRRSRLPRPTFWKGRSRSLSLSKEEDTTKIVGTLRRSQSVSTASDAVLRRRSISNERHNLTSLQKLDVGRPGRKADSTAAALDDNINDPSISGESNKTRKDRASSKLVQEQLQKRETGKENTPISLKDSGLDVRAKKADDKTHIADHDPVSTSFDVQNSGKMGSTLHSSSNSKLKRQVSETRSEIVNSRDTSEKPDKKKGESGKSTGGKLVRQSSEPLAAAAKPARTIRRQKSESESIGQFVTAEPQSKTVNAKKSDMLLKQKEKPKGKVDHASKKSKDDNRGQMKGRNIKSEDKSTDSQARSIEGMVHDDGDGELNDAPSTTIPKAKEIGSEANGNQLLENTNPEERALLLPPKNEPFDETDRIAKLKTQKKKERTRTSSSKVKRETEGTDTQSTSLRDTDTNKKRTKVTLLDNKEHVQDSKEFNGGNVNNESNETKKVQEIPRRISVDLRAESEKIPEEPEDQAESRSDSPEDEKSDGALSPNFSAPNEEEHHSAERQSDSSDESDSNNNSYVIDNRIGDEHNMKLSEEDKGSQGNNKNTKDNVAKKATELEARKTDGRKTNPGDPTGNVHELRKVEKIEKKQKGSISKKDEKGTKDEKENSYKGKTKAKSSEAAEKTKTRKAIKNISEKDAAKSEQHSEKVKAKIKPSLSKAEKNINQSSMENKNSDGREDVYMKANRSKEERVKKSFVPENELLKDPNEQAKELSNTLTSPNELMMSSHSSARSAMSNPASHKDSGFSDNEKMQSDEGGSSSGEDGGEDEEPQSYEAKGMNASNSEDDEESKTRFPQAEEKNDKALDYHDRDGKDSKRQLKPRTRFSETKKDRAEIPVSHADASNSKRQKNKAKFSENEEDDKEIPAGRGETKRDVDEYQKAKAKLQNEVKANPSSQRMLGADAGTQSDATPERQGKRVNKAISSKLDFSHVKAKVNTRGFDPREGRASSLPRVHKPRARSWERPASQGANYIDPNTITQVVEQTMRKYRLERKLFEELQDLKRCQIRSTRAHENMMVKRLVDKFRKESKAPGMGDFEGPYTYRNYERFLYDQLRRLSSSNRGKLEGIVMYDDGDIGKRPVSTTPVTENPEATHCVNHTYKCNHTIEAYSGQSAKGRSISSSIPHEGLPQINISSGYGSYYRAAEGAPYSGQMPSATSTASSLSLPKAVRVTSTLHQDTQSKIESADHHHVENAERKQKLPRKPLHEPKWTVQRKNGQAAQKELDFKATYPAHVESKQSDQGMVALNRTKAVNSRVHWDDYKRMAKTSEDNGSLVTLMYEVGNQPVDDSAASSGSPTKSNAEVESALCCNCKMEVGKEFLSDPSKVAMGQQQHSVEATTNPQHQLPDNQASSVVPVQFAERQLHPFSHLSHMPPHIQQGNIVPPSAESPFSSTTSSAAVHVPFGHQMVHPYLQGQMIPQQYVTSHFQPPSGQIQQMAIPFQQQPLALIPQGTNQPAGMHYPPLADVMTNYQRQPDIKSSVDPRLQSDATNMSSELVHESKSQSVFLPHINAKDANNLPGDKILDKHAENLLLESKFSTTTAKQATLVDPGHPSTSQTAVIKSQSNNNVFEMQPNAESQGSHAVSLCKTCGSVETTIDTDAVQPTTSKAEVTSEMKCSTSETTNQASADDPSVFVRTEPLAEKSAASQLQDSKRDRCVSSHSSFLDKDLRKQVRDVLGSSARTSRSGAQSRTSHVDKKNVTFEIKHGREKNVFMLPADRLQDNKKWQVTFTIGKKGGAINRPIGQHAGGGDVHSLVKKS